MCGVCVCVCVSTLGCVCVCVCWSHLKNLNHLFNSSFSFILHLRDCFCFNIQAAALMTDRPSFCVDPIRPTWTVYTYIFIYIYIHIYSMYTYIYIRTHNFICVHKNLIPSPPSPLIKKLSRADNLVPFWFFIEAYKASSDSLCI